MAVFAHRSALLPLPAAAAPVLPPAAAPDIADAAAAADEHAAAATSDKKGTSSPEPRASGGAGAVFAVALGLSVFLFGTDSFGPDYTPAEGVGAFALFYIVAQAAERFVEFFLSFADHRPKGKKEKVDARDQTFVDAINSAARTGQPTHEKAQAAANAQAELDQLKANRTALAFGYTAAIGMVLCAYLEADFLSAVGVHWGKKDSPHLFDEVILLAVTGLLVGGGSKALHDTISSISKSSNKKDTPAETGGTS